VTAASILAGFRSGTAAAGLDGAPLAVAVEAEVAGVAAAEADAAVGAPVRAAGLAGFGVALSVAQPITTSAMATAMTGQARRVWRERMADSS
jgi:hypothetical protein